MRSSWIHSSGCIGYILQAQGRRGVGRVGNTGPTALKGNKEQLQFKVVHAGGQHKERVLQSAHHMAVVSVAPAPGDSAGSRDRHWLAWV